MPLSRAARDVFGVRHQDIDLVQYCPRCKHPTLFMESTSSTGPKYTEVLRIIAERFDAPVLMIRHAWNDVQHQHPVDLYLWEPGNIMRNAEPDKVLEGTNWEAVKSVMLNTHERHEC